MGMSRRSVDPKTVVAALLVMSSVLLVARRSWREHGHATLPLLSRTGFHLHLHCVVLSLALSTRQPPYKYSIAQLRFAQKLVQTTTATVESRPPVESVEPGYRMPTALPQYHRTRATQR